MAGPASHSEAVLATLKVHRYDADFSRVCKSNVTASTYPITAAVTQVGKFHAISDSLKGADLGPRSDLAILSQEAAAPTIKKINGHASAPETEETESSDDSGIQDSMPSIPEHSDETGQCAITSHMEN